jgi:hypothetical protein
MASGHVNRIKRPNTWLHRPMLQNVKKALANPEPSTHGTKRSCSIGRAMSAPEGRTDFSRVGQHLRLGTAARSSLSVQVRTCRDHDAPRPVEGTLPTFRLPGVKVICALKSSINRALAQHEDQSRQGK